jgi:hypothetical protein
MATSQWWLSRIFQEEPMKGYLRAGLIVLASVPIVLTPTGFAASSPPHEPAHAGLFHISTDPTPVVSRSPSRSASEPPRTNLTAIVDPIAVPVRGGVQIRVGTRNSGPLSGTAPADQPAVTLNLVFGRMGHGERDGQL